MNNTSARHTIIALSQPQSLARNAAIVLAASLLVGMAAHVVLPLPFTPVPLSMAPFAVLLIGLTLTPRIAGAALIAYLAEGAAGLPFFSPLGPGGIAHLAWPTAGYLFAYPLAAFAISALYRTMGRSYFAALTAAATGSAIILTCGALWLATSLHLSAQAALAAGMAPFLLAELLKDITAASAAQIWKRIRN